MVAKYIFFEVSVHIVTSTHWYEMGPSSHQIIPLPHGSWKWISSKNSAAATTCSASDRREGGGDSVVPLFKWAGKGGSLKWDLKVAEPDLILLFKNDDVHKHIFKTI